MWGIADASFSRVAGPLRSGELRGLRQAVVLLAVMVFPLSVTACRQEKGAGMLVAEYAQGSNTMFFKSKIILPSAEDHYRFSYELRSGEKLCQLTGELGVKEIPREGECSGVGGRGKLSCDDAKPVRVQWSMSSCQSGTGRSMGKGNARFVFGYAHNKERAQDLLERVKNPDR